MESTDEVTRYRDGMAGLLTKLNGATADIERWLDIEVSRDEVWSLTEAWLGDNQRDSVAAKSLLYDDPVRVYRVFCALLLHKAWMHVYAVIRANEINNLHSLAVQMRPVLECAGQVVFIFHHLIIAPEYLMVPERAMSKVTNYMDSDFYQTNIRATKGGVGHKKLLQMISRAAEDAAADVGVGKPEGYKGGRLRQDDKVAMLSGGKGWYDYLSEHFCHSDANWAGPSWRGGVGSMDVTHALTCAGLMQYLAEQVAVMNAHASLCPIDGSVDESRVESALACLRDVRKVSADLCPLDFDSLGDEE